MKGKCCECGDEYNHSFDFRSPDPNNSDEMFGHYLDKALNCLDKDKTRIFSGDHYSGFVIVVFMGTKDQSIEARDLIEKFILN